MMFEGEVGLEPNKDLVIGRHRGVMVWSTIKALNYAGDTRNSKVGGCFTPFFVRFIPGEGGMCLDQGWEEKMGFPLVNIALLVSRNSNCGGS